MRAVASSQRIHAAFCNQPGDKVMDEIMFAKSVKNMRAIVEQIDCAHTRNALLMLTNMIVSISQRVDEIQDNEEC